MLDIAFIEIFVNKKMLFNRDIFRSACNVLCRRTNVYFIYASWLELARKRFSS